MRAENSGVTTRSPSPLAGEGGRRSRTDEGSAGRSGTDGADPTRNFTSHRSINPTNQIRARSLRAEATEPEKALWRVLRDHRLSETKWRRQVPIGAYIVDFVCFEHRVIVECDGSQHAENPYDEKRGAWLRSQNFKIARFWNHDVMKARAGVLDTILAECGLPW